MLITNRHDQYGIIAILFHWVMAIIIIGLIALGLYMADLPISMEKLKLYGWHKEFGMLVLMLVTCRLMWRLGNITPELSQYLNHFEIFAARVVHYLFYLCMFLMPITGWLISSAAGLPVSFFNLFVIPTIISANKSNLEFYETIHEWLAYFLIILICGHVAAALKHHFINKDPILRRMF